MDEEASGGLPRDGGTGEAAFDMSKKDEVLDITGAPAAESGDATGVPRR